MTKRVSAARHSFSGPPEPLVSAHEDVVTAAQPRSAGVPAHPARVLQELARGARRRLGQNFLVSASIARSIVQAAEIQPTDQVLEIGPGLGVLTGQLLPLARQVVAVELDASLAAELPARLGHPANLHVAHADALKVDLA